jgi:hypothetical protein
MAEFMIFLCERDCQENVYYIVTFLYSVSFDMVLCTTVSNCVYNLKCCTKKYSACCDEEANTTV